MENITIETKQDKQVIDITPDLQNIVNRTKIQNGICTAFILHTTCTLTTADLDPGTDKDYLDAIEKMFPKGNYRHPHNPGHVGDHIMSSIIGNSVSVPVENGKISLGTWQRIVLIELNGPRKRNLKAHVEEI